MPKYSDEFKISVVKAYLAGDGGTEFLAKKYNVARSCIRQWVAQYEATGKITKPTRHFSGEFKLKVLTISKSIIFQIHGQQFFSV